MHDVIVVGAGVAGLTAASELQAAGLDVVVLEARDLIGGRTHTASVGNGLIDLGAAWVHDPLNNPLTAYLDSLGISMRSDGMWGQGMGVFSRDEWLPSELTATLVAAFYNFDPRAAIKALGSGTDRSSDGIDWYVDTQLGPSTNGELVQAFLSQVEGAGVTGDHPTEISLEGMAAYEGDESGHNSVIAGGYQTLVRSLAAGLDIKLSTPAARVEHSDRGVRVASDESFDGRLAVVTAPLGVLKNGSIEFRPNLPDTHLEAIKRLKVKSLEKVAFTFEERFWGEAVSQVAVLDDEHGFIWVHDFSPHAGVTSLVGLYNPATALVDITGRDAPEAFATLLKRMFGAIPKVVDMATSDWRADPYSLGSYSYIPVGASAGDMATLAEPIGSRLILAGEHTVPAYYGTVQAAWLSGLRAAEHVINSIAG